MYSSWNKPIIFLSLFPFLSTILFPQALSLHPCTDKFLELATARKFTNCRKLSTLGAELGWTEPSPSAANHHLFHILVGAALDEDMGWLAWGVNPGPQPEMVGTRAAIGIKDPSKTSLVCNTYNVTNETRIGCQLRPSLLDEVQCTSFEYEKSTGYHVVSATLNLSSTDYNISRLNMVWQIGYKVEGDEPKQHVATIQNVDSVETLNLVSGKSLGIAHIKIRLRKVHGIFNIIGWGTLLPVGVIVARFFRKFPFDSNGWWYTIHTWCQGLGFAIGVVGWAIGMWLGHASSRYVFLTHRIFAIFIFSFVTLQTMAIWFRPGPRDDFRKVWNIYHHFLGYALLAVIFANIFEGIRILKAGESWRRAVIGILGALATITLMLEAYTWTKFFGTTKDELPDKTQPNSSKKSEEPDHETELQPTLDTPPARRIANLRTRKENVPLFLDQRIENT